MALALHAMSLAVPDAGWGIEARAVRGGAPGPASRSSASARWRAEQAASLVSVTNGTVGDRRLSPERFDERLQPGDIVLASELRGPDGTVACAIRRSSPESCAGRAARLNVGPIVSSPRLVHGARRRELAATGALAVDMESAWLAEAHGRPV